ncbi:hypothetical protein SDC9_104956 [bioreactor metagenome]|uniref:Uncharacterized protein n=1 Tax=bioreactor metagenome TaxID=1076179 RepID=A0A645AY83_9ZZZZ
MDGERFVVAFCAIFMLQTILNDFVLKRTHCADHLSAIHFQGEKLRHTFVHQLVDSLRELFCLQWIFIIDISEMFR